jgi:hypothetical protein
LSSGLPSESTTPGRADLEVYGLVVRIEGEWHEIVDAVRRDFAWFERPYARSAPMMTVAVERRAPDFDRFRSARAKFVTPRNVVYQDGDWTIVDYFGRAISVIDRESGRVTIQGEEAHLVHEAAYQFLLSSIGSHLDARKLVRLHALGLAGRSGGVAVMLPSGGGKSTLGLRALSDERVQLVSEDTPLLDAGGRLHPFPLRIGVNPTDAELLPHGSVRRIERMEFHPKLVLDLEAFAHRVVTHSVPLTHIVVGHRSLGTDARLEPGSRRAAASALLREAVVGLGVYQGLEFLLQHGWRDAFGKAGIGATRVRCCASALRRADPWMLTVGRDRERNWEALSPLLD